MIKCCKKKMKKMDTIKEFWRDVKIGKVYKCIKCGKVKDIVYKGVRS